MKSVTTFVAGAAFLSFAGIAHADTQFVWLECEAHNAAGTIVFATSHFFTVETDIASDRFAGMSDDPDDAADAIFGALQEDEDLLITVIEEYGDGFRDTLRESGGWACGNDRIDAGGPNPTLEEAKRMRDTVQQTYIATRKEFYGVDMEIREFDYPEQK